VTVAEDVRLDHQRIAHDPLYREAATVEFRRYLLDGDAIGGEREKCFRRFGIVHLSAGGGRTGLRMEEACLERPQRHRGSWWNGASDTVRVCFDERAETAACRGDKRPDLDAVLASRIGVQQEQGRVRGDARVRSIEPRQSEHGGVRSAHSQLQTFGGQRRDVALHRVGRRYEAGKVEPRLRCFPFPVRRPGLHHVKALGEPVFEPHRHHDGAGETGGEAIAQPVCGLEFLDAHALEFMRQAIGVVTFRKSDGRRDVAILIVLVQQPR